MSDSAQPDREEPTRLPCHWDSPGKNTGMACHFLLQFRKVKNESELIQSCLTLSHPMDCRPPGSPVHGIFQARVLEWAVIAFSSISLYLSTFQNCTSVVYSCQCMAKPIQYCKVKQNKTKKKTLPVLVPPIPFQHHRIHSSLLPFKV